MPNEPETLYGVIGWNPTFGPYEAEAWANLRAGSDRWGKMTDKQSVLYFYDVVARDEFITVFGGQRATLHRKAQKTLTGEAAEKMIRRMGSAS